MSATARRPNGRALPAGPLALALALALATAACSPRGREVYFQAGCHACHGPDRGGTMTSGPPLRGLRSHWDVEGLLVYFDDPDSVVAETPRLRELRGRYGTGMPPVKRTEPEARRALAKWLLRPWWRFW